MKIREIAYHRNGVAGNGFHVVTFKGGRRISQGVNRNFPEMVAIVFEEPGNVAVFDRELLGEGIIAFAENSWRGDYYEKELRAVINAKEDT
jgi:hypothetical protein